MKIGITAGAFDLCHAGHVVLFREAKRYCDHLIIALHIDPSRERKYKKKPVMTASERYLILYSNEDVDEIIPYETEAEYEEMLLLLKPDVRFVGSDWKEKESEITAKDAVPIVFIERRHHQSSTNIRERLKK